MASRELTRPGQLCSGLAVSISQKFTCFIQLKRAMMIKMMMMMIYLLKDFQSNLSSHRCDAMHGDERVKRSSQLRLIIYDNKSKQKSSNGHWSTQDEWSGQWSIVTEESKEGTASQTDGRREVRQSEIRLPYDKMTTRHLEVQLASQSAKSQLVSEIYSTYLLLTDHDKRTNERTKDVIHSKWARWSVASIRSSLTFLTANI